MSQRDLAADISISTMALNRAINGAATPEAEAIIKIAQYYEVTTDSLLGLEKLKIKRKRVAS